MEITEVLKNYGTLKRKCALGTLSPKLKLQYESITTVIGTGELFPILKAHYIDGQTIDLIACQSGYDTRTIYRHQKIELKELETIINGNWIM